MNNDRNRIEETAENEKRLRSRNPTVTRSRTSTGEISNDEIDDDAMDRDEISGETTRGDLGAGE